jgi:hypothetical protein
MSKTADRVLGVHGLVIAPIEAWLVTTEVTVVLGKPALIPFEILLILWDSKNGRKNSHWHSLASKHSGFSDRCAYAVSNRSR